MKDNATPATKADIQELLKEFKKVNGRIDGRDQRIDKFDQRFDALDGRVDGLEQRIEALDNKLDAFRKETGEKLEEIHRECAVLVENSHIDLAGATRDADQMREKNTSLEERNARLEEVVGLTAA